LQTIVPLAHVDIAPLQLEKEHVATCVHCKLQLDPPLHARVHRLASLQAYSQMEPPLQVRLACAALTMLPTQCAPPEQLIEQLAMVSQLNAHVQLFDEQLHMLPAEQSSLQQGLQPAVHDCGQAARSCGLARSPLDVDSRSPLDGAARSPTAAARSPPGPPVR
jgi:hypothetical protein